MEDNYLETNAEFKARMRATRIDNERKDSESRKRNWENQQEKKDK